MKWNLNKSISLGFCLAFLMLIAVGIISYYSLNQFRDVTRKEIKSRKTLADLENVNSHFKEIDAGVYGFALTGSFVYLEPYNNARILIDDQIAALEKSYDQKERVEQLQVLLQKKLKVAEEVIRLRKFKGQQAAIEKVQQGEGKHLMDKVQSLMLRMKLDESQVYDLQSYKADGNARLTILFIFFGNLIALSFLLLAVFLLNRDIGRLVNTEKELSNVVDIAEKAKAREEQFLANMSHEIRTPMNAIIGMTNLILKTKLEPKQASYLKAIKQSSDNLMVIINEILDFSKITAGKIEFEQVNFYLSDIFYGLYNTFKIKADEKKLKLNPVIDENLPDTVIGDPGKLNQVLINLIGNSIKFTNNGSIVMSCRLLERVGDDLLIEFSVEDTGIGIPQNKLNTIFEDFAQAASDTNRKFGGTGLGLSISKKIVELQGGDISVKSRLGKGTTFSFRLNFKVGTERPVKKEKNAKTKAQELHGLKILLVDDNEFNRVVAVDTLNSLIKNLTIDEAENGKVALDKLRENKDYDIVLMDVQMPELNGYETTKYIRKHKELGYSDIPILAMTASATKPEIDRCFDSGMTGFVSKPFEADVLLIKISSQINKEKKEELREEVIEEVTALPDQFADKASDLSFLKGMTAGNQEQMLKYINMFLESAPSDWQKLKKLAEEDKWPEVRVVAHSMKPRVKYMGIKKGSEVLLQIEHFSAEQINLETIPALIVKFEEILSLAVKELELEKQTLVNLSNQTLT